MNKTKKKQIKTKEIIKITYGSGFATEGNHFNVGYPETSNC